MSTTYTSRAKAIAEEGISRRRARVEGVGYAVVAAGVLATAGNAGAAWAMVAMLVGLALLPAVRVAIAPRVTRWLAAASVQLVMMHASGVRHLLGWSLAALPAALKAAQVRIVRATTSRIAARLLARAGVVHVCVQPSHVTTAQGSAA